MTDSFVRDDVRTIHGDLDRRRAASPTEADLAGDLAIIRVMIAEAMEHLL